MTRRINIDEKHRSAILEEYRTLREEIKYSSQIRLLIITFSTCAWAGLAAWLVANSSYFHAEVALIVLHVPIVFGYLLVKLSDRHIVRVSTYIREFVEPMLEGLRWETLVADFQKGSKLVFSTSQVSFIAFFLLSTGAFGLERILRLPYLFRLIPRLDILILVTLWLFLAFFQFPTVLLKGSRGYEDKAISLWRTLRNEHKAREENKKGNNRGGIHDKGN